MNFVNATVWDCKGRKIFFPVNHIIALAELVSNLLEPKSRFERMVMFWHGTSLEKKVLLTKLSASDQQSVQNFQLFLIEYLLLDSVGCKKQSFQSIVWHCRRAGIGKFNFSRKNISSPTIAHMKFW